MSHFMSVIGDVVNVLDNKLTLLKLKEQCHISYKLLCRFQPIQISFVFIVKYII